MPVPTVVASAVNRNSGGEGICSATFTVSAGDLILVVPVAYETTFTTRLPTDTQSNTYTHRVGVATGTVRNSIFTAVCASAGSLTVTEDITGTGNDLACLFVQARGQVASFVHLTASVANAAASESWSLDFSDTSVSDCLIVAQFCTIAAFGTFVGGSGWTAFGSQSSAPGVTGCYGAAAAAGAYDPNGTVDTARSYSAVGIAIVGAAGGGAASLAVPNRPMQSHLVR